MRETESMMNVQRALLAKEQRTFDRKELMGWAPEADLNENTAIPCTSESAQHQPTAGVSKKRRLWEVLNATMVDSSLCNEELRREEGSDDGEADAAGTAVHKRIFMSVLV